MQHGGLQFKISDNTIQKSSWFLRNLRAVFKWSNIGVLLGTLLNPASQDSQISVRRISEPSHHEEFPGRNDNTRKPESRGLGALGFNLCTGNFQASTYFSDFKFERSTMFVALLFKKINIFPSPSYTSLYSDNRREWQYNSISELGRLLSFWHCFFLHNLSKSNMQKRISKMMYKASIQTWRWKQNLTEGLWNNSWVKNLPVRPFAPGRKTPGQLYPLTKDLPGWANKTKKKSEIDEWIDIRYL